MSNSSVSLVTAILVGIVLFGLGYVWNAFRGARILLKGAKGSVPKARSLYWGSLGRLLKWGAIAVAVVFVLVTWSTRDASSSSTPPPSPASSSSPSSARR